MSNNALITTIVVVVIIVGGLIWLTNRSTTTPIPTATPLTTTDMTFGDMTDDMPITSSSPMTSPMVSPGVSTSPMTSPTTGASTTGSTTGTVKSFTVTGSSFKFSPATMTVKQGDTVRVTFINSGGMHDWRIDEFNAGTQVLQAGQQETVEFVANKKGQFEYYCSVANHRQMGMKGTLTVE